MNNSRIDEIMLNLLGEEIIFSVDLLPTEHISSTQILITLLDMDANQIERFLQG